MPVVKNVSVENQTPVFDALCEEIGQYEIPFRGADADFDKHAANLKLLQSGFATFCSSGELQLILNNELRKFQTTDGIPPVSNNTLLLAESDSHVMSVSVLRPITVGQSQLMNAESSLLTQSSDCLIAEVSKDKTSLPIYDILPADKSGGSPQIRLRGTMPLLRARPVLLNARKEFMDFSITSESVIARLTSKAFLPYIWLVDRAHLKVIMTSASVPSLSRIPLALKLAARLLAEETKESVGAAYDCNIDLVKRYTDHEYHYVRWAAIQNLCYHDIEVGHPYLIKSLNDSHPEVRDAARRALDLIG
jgi:hypothetical protein